MNLNKKSVAERRWRTLRYLEIEQHALLGFFETGFPYVALAVLALTL